MRAVIYARFSSQLQKDSSIEDQVRVCTERAAREGWRIVEVFSDYAISGAVRDRPGLNALLARVGAGSVDVVLAEAIDRLSRDQEDLSAIFKRVGFHGARIVTLSEGTVDELQIGFKGTMASLFRKDLADKIRRGAGGRVAIGRAPGNIVYGYRKIARLDDRGEPVRGLREIDPDQAAVVRRIYREYLAGESPLAIARRLNAERIPSPSGKQWNVSAINGDNVRANGILCNPIYAGELVYNRTTMVRDPATRKRVPRTNPPEQWQRQPVPELRIVDQESWEAVRDRKTEWKVWGFATQRRPKRLLSGLAACGSCGGSMAIIGDNKIGCTGARRGGTCRNLRTIDAGKLERRVTQALRSDLLSPDRVALAHKEYREDRARKMAEERAASARDRKRAAELDRQIANYLTAIAAGADDIAEVVESLRRLRDERAALIEAIGDDAAEKVIILHPQFAKAYEAAVGQVLDYVNGTHEENQAARNAIRNLIDRIVLTPKPNSPRGLDIEIEGRLAAMLDLAQGRSPSAKKGTVSLVAEERSGRRSTLRRIKA